MDISKYSSPITLNSNNKTGIIVLHGFTSTPDSVKYYSNGLYKAGFNVEAPCLKGHGSKWEDMNNLKYQDWIDDALGAYRKLKERAENIFVAGLSMGGTVGLHLAALKSDIKGIILINHALFLKRNWKLLFLPFIKNISKSSDAKVGGDLKDKSEYEHTYDKIPLEGLSQLMKIMRKARNLHNQISKPVLIFKSEIDHVIPAKSAIFTYKNISSNKKELIWLKNSYHVATQDYDKDLIIEKSVDFIDNLTG